MNQRKVTKKLNLNKETVRSLSENELSSIGSGARKTGSLEDYYCFAGVRTDSLVDYMCIFRNIAILLLVFTFAACASSSYDAGWQGTGDRDAVVAQRLLDQTVKVEVTAVANVSVISDFLENVPENGLKAFNWSGSGTVTNVAQRVGGLESLVLTAAHVCHVEDAIELPFGLPSLPVVSSEIRILNSAGTRMVARVVKKDMVHDVCVLAVSGRAGEVATIARKNPPVGAKIVHAGAPTGTYGRHLGVVIDGRYAGLESMDDGVLMVAMSVPAAGGSSGGGVYYRGELFAVLVLASSPNANITWAVELTHVTTILEEARRDWR